MPSITTSTYYHYYYYYYYYYYCCCIYRCSSAPHVRAAMQAVRPHVGSLRN